MMSRLAATGNRSGVTCLSTASSAIHWALEIISNEPRGLSPADGLFDGSPYWRRPITPPQTHATKTAAFASSPSPCGQPDHQHLLAAWPQSSSVTRIESPASLRDAHRPLIDCPTLAESAVDRAILMTTGVARCRRWRGFRRWQT